MIRWRLRVVMAERCMSNEELAKKINQHHRESFQHEKREGDARDKRKKAQQLVRGFELHPWRSNSVHPGFGGEAGMRVLVEWD